jgi:hypothetical protein
MSRISLACICLGLIYGGVDSGVGGGSFLNTAMAKGHSGHKGGGHKGAHKKSHHAAHHHAAHHHAAHHHSQHHAHHHAKHHAHAHATGHAAHRVHAHARHFAHHGNHHHHHHWHNGHRYWVGNGYYGGSSVDGGTVVGDGSSAVVAPPLVGSAATLAYPTVLGHIGSIAGNALTIVRRNGKVTRVTTTPATIITLNDHSAAMADLRITDRVKASYDPASNAIKVVARRD